MGKKLLIFAGVICMLQAVTQVAASCLALVQYYCVVDFLHVSPNLLYLKILYFHNRNSCGNVINIGQSISGIANQAFVLLENQTFTSYRTFIMNCTSLGLSFLWAIASGFLLAGGVRNEFSRPIRWPWVTVTVAVCALDLVGSVTFANDSFHTKTLDNIMNYIGGTASGVGGRAVNTAAASWIMFTLYSRFAIFFFLNVFLIIVVSLNKNISCDSDKIDVEENVNTTTTPVAATPPVLPSQQTVLQDESVSKMEDEDNLSDKKDETTTNFSETSGRKHEWLRISMPRAYLNRKLQITKKKIYDSFLRYKSPEKEAPNEVTEDFRSSEVDNFDVKRNTSNNFPSIIIDKTEHGSVNQTKRKANPTNDEIALRRCSTIGGELGGRAPWSYVPASTHYMRDQLKPDEDLPPVPLPDYTAIASSSSKLFAGSTPCSQQMDLKAFFLPRKNNANKNKKE